MSYNIEGKVALVTGANRGIGKAIVEVFLAHGATKVYAGVRTLESAAPLVEKFGDRVVPIQIDVADDATVKAAAQTATDVQVVINNAGVLKVHTPLDPAAFEGLEYEIDINVGGLLRMAQAFAPVLKRNGGGVFGNLNSVVSLKNFANFATYGASKAAAYSMTQALRELLAEQGTHVLSIHPGPIATDMANSAGLQDIAEPPSQVGDAIIAALKAGEFHVWTDTMSRQMGEAYHSFAKNVIETQMAEA